jgi:hypothetical protein
MNGAAHECRHEHGKNKEFAQGEQACGCRRQVERLLVAPNGDKG